MSKRRAEYQVQLELQRDQEKLKQKLALKEQDRQREEESIGKTEGMRRQTMEYEYQLKSQLKQAELDAQKQTSMEIEASRQASTAALIKQQESERRETQKQGIITMVQMMSSSVGQLFANPKAIMKTAYFSLMMFGSFYFAKTFVQLSMAAAFSRFGKPQLVRETSKLHARNYMALPYMYAKKIMQKQMRRTEKDLLDGVILDKKLEMQLREISYAVLNRKKHYAPCKNLMFYGPPGTGKTLFAKKLATQSGLEYAVMVGSDIAPLGPLAVGELNKLFDWAENQKNGIILFIDEADAFLRNRKDDEMSESMRHSINSFLYRTGSPSERVIVVMATNAPDQLDEAVHDRIDEVVGFGLPSENERKTMLYHYLVKYCQAPTSTMEKLQFAYKYPRSIFREKKLITMEGVNHEVIEDIAKQSEGFSGRELTKMVIAWHDAAFTTDEAILTPDIMYKILKKFHLQHELKKTWTKEEELVLGKMNNLDVRMTGTKQEQKNE